MQLSLVPADGGVRSSPMNPIAVLDWTC